MMDIEQGFKKKNKNGDLLDPIIRGWIDAMSKYLLKESNDPPYLYNERANVSLLCAGAWLKGLVALEEYMSLKGERRGRPDLYINIDEKGISIEAKRKWLKASSKNIPSKTFISYMKLALNDVQRVDEDQGRIKFGIAFFPVFFLESEFKDFRKSSYEYIKHEIDKYDNQNYADLLAWYFPLLNRNERRFHNATKKSLPAYYPGIILGAKKLGTRH